MRMPTSSAIGMVMPSACGTSVASTRDDDVPRRAFGNERFAVLQNRRNFEREREQQQRRARTEP